jgi:hypothetical protein
MTIKLTITIENGKLSVDGPLEDKILSLGMLEMAKPAIIGYNAKSIVPASAADAVILKANGG